MSQPDKIRRTVLASLAAVAAMVGLVVASVPLYDLFCRVTGYGGTPRVAASTGEVVSDRIMTIRFDSNTMPDLEWRFSPDQRSMDVRLGESGLAFYTATNTGDEPVVGTATFNVTPMKAGIYFNKVECFCFTEQVLQPGESIQMPVSFFVDPALAEDRYVNEVTTITLSYTFFRAQDQSGAAAQNANVNDNGETDSNGGRRS
ncbi:cytochrome c oxidase assembly protein [Telmatospirillum sp. J64-1]|uniref:cytochrome c oxidase assembly protein n=1 Tax=Telmatospirillum sp. J64-1 TaxID=2502183 RepID=UPI00115CD5EE|nr:cytochrome c oxidase assembly protein [Telmatospirillum sp. J64-1]